MDVIRTQDQSIETETPRQRLRQECNIDSFMLTGILPKTQRKKVETKKLKKKLSEIEEKNENLTNAINEKNAEIAELKKSVNSLNDVLNSVPLDELRCNSSIASAKLLEFSKKNRQLRAELETAKNRLTKKDIQIQKLEKDLKMSNDKHEQQEKDIAKRNIDSGLEELQTKCSSLQQKLFETRNKNAELHSQLKLAQKCLQQEIGENFNLNVLASHATTGSWRGRAQQILHLQQKVQELKERLDGYQMDQQQLSQYTSYVNPNQEARIPISSNNNNNTNGNNSKNHFNVNDSARPPSIISACSMGSFDRPTVRRTEIQHRAKVEGLEKEIADLKGQLDEHRNKILALKVRNKTLNDDILRYKIRTSSLEEQTDFTNMNVASMNEEWNIQKRQYEKRIEELKRELTQTLKECDEMQLREEKMNLQIDNHKMQLSEKEAQMNEMKSTIKKLENDLKAVCGGFLFSCRELRKDEFIGILDTLEGEKDSLMQRNQKLNERIEQERHKNENLQDLMMKQKIRIARTEAKLRDLEKEMDAQSERRKRTQRISDYAMNLNAINSATSIPSLCFENSSQTSLAKGTSAMSTQSVIDDLKNRLELSEEKIAMLKEKLDYISMEKENDLKHFEEIIGKTKTMIIDAITSQRNNGIGPCTVERLGSTNTPIESNAFSDVLEERNN